MSATPNRLTRSASKRSANQLYANPPFEEPTTPTRSPKRSKTNPVSPGKTPKSPAPDFTKPVLEGPIIAEPVLEVPSRLNFDYEEAKAHLIKADPRFRTLFRRLPCKPYEQAAHEHSTMNPFRALATSVLGQQVSWLAAKAITYKFCRLFHPELPEKQEPGSPPAPFPTPAQVVNCPYATLRTAGLSGRKAEYLIDISARFADGRLSAEKLMAMSDEEVYNSLIVVRGIGPWSVEMFQMFVLRRPNIMSAGDLGLQKGLITWFGQEHPQIILKKLSDPDSAATVSPAKPAGEVATPMISRTAAPEPSAEPVTPSSGIDSAAAASKVSEQAPPFPPSKTLTRDKLNGRLNKKVKGNMYLTAEEMEELTASWTPYRSVGLWYMWAIKDGEDSSI